MNESIRQQSTKYKGIVCRYKRQTKNCNNQTSVITTK